MIYLDYAANTPADEAVLRRFCQTESTFSGNPNSTHRAGRMAREELARVTDAIAGLLGVRPPEIIYTSGASESNNLAVKGLARAAKGRHILSTPLEHSSVSGSLEALKGQGYQVELVGVRPDGTLDLEELKKMLRPDTALVAVTAVDSELGAVQPIREISEILRDYPDCRLHIDATQAIGKIPVSFEGADTMSLTAHKLYGLNGVGILVKRRFVPMEPLIHGGLSTTAFRSGTPALALAASMETALRLALEEQEGRNQLVRAHSAYLRRELGRYPRVRFNSPEDAVPHILNLSVRDVKGTVFQRKLDEQGVCVSVKSACAEAGAPSRAVMAVTGDRRNALSSWRVSLSHLTTRQELDGFLAAFDRCYPRDG